MAFNLDMARQISPEENKHGKQLKSFANILRGLEGGSMARESAFTYMFRHTKCVAHSQCISTTMDRNIEMPARNGLYTPSVVIQFPSWPAVWLLLSQRELFAGEC